MFYTRHYRPYHGCADTERANHTDHAAERFIPQGQLHSIAQCAKQQNCNHRSRGLQGALRAFLRHSSDFREEGFRCNCCQRLPIRPTDTEFLQCVLRLHGKFFRQVGCAAFLHLFCIVILRCFCPRYGCKDRQQKKRQHEANHPFHATSILFLSSANQSKSRLRNVLKQWQGEHKNGYFPCELHFRR